jgi:hypothetical protein
MTGARVLWVLSFVAAALPRPVCGQPVQETPAPPQSEVVVTAPLIEETPSGNVTASGGVGIVYGETRIRAETAEGNHRTGEWTASGSVVLQRPDGTLHADSVRYNLRTDEGLLQSASGTYGLYTFSGRSARLSPDGVLRVQEASGTTCGLEHAHWRLTAREVVVHPGRHASARRIGFWIGNTRVISFPAYRLSLQDTQQIFPTPGIEQQDGAYLKLTYPFATSYTSAASVEGRVTQKRGLQGVVELERAILGAKPRKASLTRDVPPDLMGAGLLSGQDIAVEAPGTLAPRANVFLRYGRRQRVYDPDVRYLYLDRQPEAGVRLLGSELPWRAEGPWRLALDAQGGVGRFRERTDGIWRTRYDVRVVLRTERARPLAWVLDPVLLARVSWYSDGRHQTILGGSIGVGRQVTERHFAAVTYARHFTDGSTPFEFDNIDVGEKLATRLQSRWGLLRSDLVVDFDLERGGVYDWGLRLSRVFHCIEPRITYQNRYRSFNVDLKLVGL